MGMQQRRQASLPSSLLRTPPWAQYPWILDLMRGLRLGLENFRRADQDNDIQILHL